MSKKMKISIGVDDLVTDISVMTADETTKLQVGSVLELMTMVPCVAKRLCTTLPLAGLNVSIGDIPLRDWFRGALTGLD
jgi:hypothetical protein